MVDDEHLSLWQFIVLLNVLLYISRIRFLHSGRKSLPSDQQWPTLCHSDLHSVHSDLHSVHSDLQSVHSDLHSVHSDLQSVHSDLHSVHNGLNSVQYCISVLTLVSATVRTFMYNLYKTKA